MPFNGVAWVRRDQKRLMLNLLTCFPRNFVSLKVKILFDRKLLYFGKFNQTCTYVTQNLII